MKLIDMIIKALKTNRNTFFTFILTLLTIYIAIDRIVEMLLMIFTGVAVSYWSPIAYTLALACPVFAFAFSGKSSYADTRASKLIIFYTFLIGLYTISLSLFVQSLNMVAWLLFISSPNYVDIVTNFSELIRPAFCALSLYLPLVTIYPFIKFILLKVNDTQSMVKSIWRFRGIDLSDKKSIHTPYHCDIKMFKDFDNNRVISLSEKARFRSLLVCGGSGSGKTSMIFEPMIAQDIEKKYFFNEVSKELGFTALKTGIANLTKPFSNEYLNNNFNLNMITPFEEKSKLFDNFLKKMIISNSPYVFRNIGLTYISQDYETVNRMMQVCNNYNITYNLIDPSQPEKSIGLNPFIYNDPIRISTIISSVLKDIVSDKADEMKNLYKEETLMQMIENLVILLKIIYPKMHSGTLPNLEDLLILLSNFDLVEKMCKILEKDENLAQNYKMELMYFKRAFFQNSEYRNETEKYAYFIESRLENLLRSPMVKNILCNRHSNINFYNAIENGEVTFLCTRRSDLGLVAHKSIGLFFLLSMQCIILSREGNENTRIPHFLYIDDFSNFVTPNTEDIFTTYRKYKVATTISVQSITQLSIQSQKNIYNNLILANCGNKIYTGGSTPIQEIEWWSNEIGKWKQWKYSQDYDSKSGKMSSNYKEPKYAYEIKMPTYRLQSLAQDRCAYKLINDSGKNTIGEGIMLNLSSKYKEKHKNIHYDFSIFNNENKEKEYYRSRDN